MSSKKYPVEKTTIDKIKNLFAYRRLSDLLRTSGLNKDKEFITDLINVQYQIYMLDGYLESQWDLDKKELGKFWEAIYASLDSMGYKKKEIARMVSEIDDYERIERNCRKDKWPTKVSLKEFYVTKSCDVRLIRHLIYLAHPDLQKMFKESAWEYFDIITEINDDIADVEEDINTFNGNRFLISILRKGADKTYKQYHDYLVSISGKAKEYFNERGDRGKNRQLAKWVNDRSIETLKLLDSRIHSKSIDKLSASLLLPYMK